MAFDYQGAKNAGYTDEQIGAYMRIKGTKHSQGSPSVGGFIGNIGKSAVENVGGIGSAIANTLNPDMEKNTIANLGKLAVGTGQLLIPGEQGLEDRPRAVGQYYKDRYGGLENIKKTAYEDPVGLVLDASVVLGGAGAGLKGLGAISKSSKLAKAGQIASKAGRVIDPVSMAGKGLSKVGSAVKPKIVGALEGMSEGYATSGLGDPKLLKEIQGVTGKKTSQLMKEYDLFDRSPASAGRAIEGLDTTITSKIKGAPNARVNDILKLFDEKIAQYNIKSGLSTSAKGQLEELLRRRQEFVDYIIKQKKSSLLSNQKKINPLVSEAKKYKSAEEFVKAQMQKKPKYGMSHRPTLEGAPPSHNLLEGDMLPRDVYSKPEWSIASGRDIRTDVSARESLQAIRKIKGNPEMEVTVYRASPKNELNSGDWVTFSKNYAKGEGAYEGSKVFAHKVKAKDVFFAGDDINEFGYFPKSQLTDIWNKSNKKKIFRRPSSITPESLREMKQIVGEDVKKFSPDASKSIQTASAQDVYNIYKDKLNELAGTKQLGRDEAGLIKLKEIFKNAEARGQGRQALGLKDFIAGGAGGTIGGVPGALGGIALRQFLDSPRGIQLVTETLQKGASGVRKAKVPNIFKKLVEGAKYERVINPK